MCHLQNDYYMLYISLRKQYSWYSDEHEYHGYIATHAHEGERDWACIPGRTVMQPKQLLVSQPMVYQVSVTCLLLLWESI